MEQLIKSYNPATGDLEGTVNSTAIKDIPNIVKLAHKAQKLWKKLSVDERIVYLQKATQNALPHAEELSILLSKEMGKDIRRSSAEVNGVINGSVYIANEVKTAIKARKTGSGTIHYMPLGVVGIISPWNYPLAMFNNLMIPALIAGNAVILKPSEETPLIADKYISLLNKILPEHLVQVIHGRKEVGQALVESDIQMIAFTGSQTAGKDIMKRAASGIKRLVMELGGNDPMIVLPDANVPMAAQYAVAASLENSGQMCTSAERIYVHESIKDTFEKQVTQIAKDYPIGSWDNPYTRVFPIINEKQRQKIISHIKDAMDKGAKVLLGGIEQPKPFIKPTVLTNVTADALMEKEETFGPVVSISGYRSIEEAIEKANDSNYGLGASVFGQNRVEEVASQLEAGMVGINKMAGASPWVGAKQSGFGFHGSIDGHRQFAQVKVIN